MAARALLNRVEVARRGLPDITLDARAAVAEAALRGLDRQPTLESTDPRSFARGRRVLRTAAPSAGQGQQHEQRGERPPHGHKPNLERPAAVLLHEPVVGVDPAVAAQVLDDVPVDRAAVGAAGRAV
jgi:hypothetical protein